MYTIPFYAIVCCFYAVYILCGCVQNYIIDNPVAVILKKSCELQFSISFKKIPNLSVILI